MKNFTLTTEQLTALVNKSFELGKLYATDELDTIQPIMTNRVPLCKDENTWREFIDQNGGHTLHSGEAKADILFEVLQDEIRTRFHQTVDFE